MTAISEAVILMAGQGSRLRGSDKTTLKPFVPVLGRPLICYTIEALIRAGIGKVSFIVGYQSDRMTMGIKQLIPSGLEPLSSKIVSGRSKTVFQSSPRPLTSRRRFF